MKAEFKDLKANAKSSTKGKSYYKVEVKSDKDVENWINKALSANIKDKKDDDVVSALCHFGIDKLTLSQSGISFVV